MEWEKEEILAELYNYFEKKYSDEERSIEEIADLNQEIFNSLKLDTPFDNMGTVTIDGTDYLLIQNEDEAERIAIEQVKNDLEIDSTMFNQEWLQDFIFISECDKNIMISEEENYLRETVTEDAENEEFENDEEKEKWIDEQVEIRLKEFEEGLEDPIEYFVNEQGIYTVEDLMNQNWIVIDFETASKEAVKTDGWPHFLSHYDGSYEESENGLIIFKDC